MKLFIYLRIFTKQHTFKLSCKAFQMIIILILYLGKTNKALFKSIYNRWQKIHIVENV